MRDVAVRDVAVREVGGVREGGCNFNIIIFACI